MKVEFSLENLITGFECGLLTAKEVTTARPVIKITIDPIDPDYDKLVEFIQAAEWRKISS